MPVPGPGRQAKVVMFREGSTETSNRHNRENDCSETYVEAMEAC